MNNGYQWLDQSFGLTSQVRDNARGIGGSVRSVQDSSDAAGADIASQIYKPSPLVNSTDEDARYDSKPNTVENIYYPAADQVAAQAERQKGFVGQMLDWLKTI